MEPGTKRRAADSADARDDKRHKTKKQWRTPRGNANTGPPLIEPGDSGIWATCNKGREGKCTGELRDLFAEYAELMYGTGAAPEATEMAPTSIENEINAEVAEMKHPVSAQLFTSVRIDVQCVVFFKTVAPIEPVSFVKRICEDALSNPHRKRTRYTKRLSPITLMGRATLEGVEKVARTVLEPSFHHTPVQPRKFAIRPTLRNFNLITREKVIQLVAQCVGSGHQVDLKNYDLLIVVEIFQNVCGVSVLDDDFERLKRYNLAEIFDPTPVAEVKAKEQQAPAPKLDNEGMLAEGSKAEDGSHLQELVKAEEAVMELDPGAEDTASTAAMR